MNSSSAQRLRPPLVVFLFFAHRVLNAIQFNRQLFFITVEIDNIWLNGMLPAKLEAAQTAIAQQRPQQLFRVGLLLTKFAGTR
jgi:hypothetical protein